MKETTPIVEYGMPIDAGTMLAPPELVCTVEAPELRFSGVFSPLATAVPLAREEAGSADASRQAPSAAAAVAAARESGISLVIEGRLEVRVARVIGP